MLQNKNKRTSNVSSDCANELAHGLSLAARNSTPSSLANPVLAARSDLNLPSHIEGIPHRCAALIAHPVTVDKTRRQRQSNCPYDN